MAAKEIAAVLVLCWAGDKVFNDKVLSGNDAQPAPVVVETDTQNTHLVLPGEGPMDVAQDCTRTGDVLGHQAVTGYVVDIVSERGYPLQPDEVITITGLGDVATDCRGPKQ
jgi:hypothetical protein